MGEHTQGHNVFNNDIKYSEDERHEPIWNDCYIKAFSGMAFHYKSSAGKSQSQQLGMDRFIHFSSGKTIIIDEKMRRIKYNDILLEYRSNKERRTPGWMNKDLHIDYIAYGFETTGEVYLLPWIQLKTAWAKNGIRWLKLYGPTEAKNYNKQGEYLYTTLSVAVPIDILISAIQGEMIINTDYFCKSKKEIAVLKG